MIAAYIFEFLHSFHTPMSALVAKSEDSGHTWENHQDIIRRAFETFINRKTFPAVTSISPGDLNPAEDMENEACDEHGRTAKSQPLGIHCGRIRPGAITSSAEKCGMACSTWW